MRVQRNCVQRNSIFKWGKSRESPKPYVVTLENIEYKIRLLCNSNTMENMTVYVTDHDMNFDKLEYEKFHNT